MRGKNKSTDKKIKEALMKRAFGFETTEIVEEYSGGEDKSEVVLTKKKVTKKPVPPDITALKILLTSEDKQVAEMTDEELVLERERLLKEICEMEKKGENDE